MKLNVDIKKKVVVNGQEYGSVAEMPEEIRRAYENAINTSLGAGQPAGPGGGGAKVVFNGREYRSLEEMPPETRRLYDMAVSAATQTERGGGSESSRPAGTEVRSPKQVYRRIWLLLYAAIALFVLIVALGMVLPANGELAARLPWALLAPLALFGCAGYTVVRHWRCGHCGAALPTIFSRLRRRHCLRCGQPFEL